MQVCFTARSGHTMGRVTTRQQPGFPEPKDKDSSFMQLQETLETYQEQDILKLQQRCRQLREELRLLGVKLPKHESPSQRILELQKRHEDQRLLSQGMGLPINSSWKTQQAEHQAYLAAREAGQRREPPRIMLGHVDTHSVDD